MTTNSGDNTVNGALSDEFYYFNTGNTTLNAGDNINGTVGNTSLNIVSARQSNSIAQGFTLTGVDTFALQNSSSVNTTQYIDLSLATGLNSLAVNNSGKAATAFTNVNNIVSASITNSQGNFSVDYVDSVVAGTANAMTVNVNGAATTESIQFATDGIETFNVNATGAATGDLENDKGLLLFSDKLTTINVTGAADVALASALTGATGTTIATAGIVNASTATGDVDLVLQNVAGTFLNVALGSGDDFVAVGTLNTNQTIAGGGGIDALGVNALFGGSNDFKNVSGFEAIVFTETAGVSAGGNINLTNAGSITTVAFEGQTADANIQGVNSGVTLELLGEDNNVLVDVIGAGGKADDVVNVTVDSADSAAALAFGTVQAANIETINLSSLSDTGKATGNNGITLTAASTKALNISGNESVAVTMASGNLSTVNASAATGAVNLTAIAAALSTTAATITGGSGNDSLLGGSGNDVIVGGNGADIIGTGNGNNTVDGGAGNDTITAGTGNDNITAGVGNDTVIFGVAGATLTTNDTVIGGDSTDILAFAGGAAVADAAFKNVSGFETISADADGDALSLTLGANAAATGITTITAKQAAGVVTGTAAVGVTALSTFTNAVTINAGSSGSDSILFAGTTASFNYVTRDSWLTAGDSVNGGTGATDTITIQANGGTAVLTNVTGVETITITANADAPAITTSGLTIGANTVTNSNTLTINAAALTGSGATFTVDASAITTTTLPGSIFVTSGNGNDTITLGSGADRAFGGVGNDYIVGAAGNDVLHGEAGNDQLFGGTGNDSLYGGNGTDVLVGSTGADFLEGGDGNDTYSYINATDSVATGTIGATVTSQASLDTVDGFNAGGGTAGTVIDKFSSAQAVTSIGAVTIGTAATTSLGGSLASNAALAAAARGSAIVITVTSGTAAGTYLAIITGTGGYTAARDTVVRLTNASNLENLTLDNFTPTVSGLTATYAGTTYTLAGVGQGLVTVNGSTGAVTDGGAAVTPTGTYAAATVQTITLAGITGNFGSNVSIVDANVALASVVGTTGNDTFTYASSDMGAAATAVNGNGGTDTVVFTTFGTAELWGTAGANRQVLTDIDAISLTAGATSLTLNASLTSAIAVTNASATDAATVLLSTGAAHTYTSASAGVDTVTLGLTGQTATLTNGGTNDVIANSVAGASVTTDATALTVSAAAGLAGNFATSATAESTLTASASGATTVTLGNISGFDILASGNNTVAVAVTSGATNSITKLSVNTTTANFTYNATVAQLDSLTSVVSTATGNALNLVATAAAGGTLNLAGMTITNADGLDLGLATSDVTVTGTAALVDSFGVIAGVGADGTTTVTTTNDAALDLSTGTFTLIDTLNFAGATDDGKAVLTLQAADLVVDNFTAINGTATSRLVSTGAADLKFTTLTGFTSIAATGAGAIITLDAASLSGSANRTLVAAGAETDLAVALVQTGDYTNVSLTASDFASITLSAGVTAQLSSNVLVTGLATIAGQTTTVESAVINAATATSAINMSGVTAVTQLNSLIANDGTGANLITTSGTDAVRTITTVNLVNGGSDQVVINNGGLTDGETNAVTIENFTTGSGAQRDQLQSKIDTAVLDNGYQANETVTKATITVAAGSVLEVGTGFGQLISTATADALVLANAAFTKSVVADQDYAVVIYGGGNAYLYQMTLADGGANPDVFAAAELVATITGVATNSLEAANFFAA